MKTETVPVPLLITTVAPTAAAGESAGVTAADSRVRSLCKAVSWRIVGTVDTIAWVWLITGKLRVSLLVGSVEALSKIVLFYGHERAWTRVPVISLPGWWPGR